MRIEAFVPTWPGPKQHPKEVVAAIAPYCSSVTVLDDPNDWFNAQWEKARAQFAGDILLWCMADVTPPENFGEMFQEGVRILSQGNVGWYAPDIAWTSYIYDRADLKKVEPGIYEVPNTDSLLFMIRKDVIGNMPNLDPALCYMWGMDLTAIGTVRAMGMKAVRDYRFKATHPNQTGYEISKAGLGMIPMFQKYPETLQREIANLEEETRKLRKPFWKDKKVTVTGGAGFLGKHVVKILNYRGCDVFVPRVEQYDLRRRPDVERMYADSEPNIVINLAAVVGGLKANIENPGKFFYDNAIMGLELMDVGRLAKIDKFVQIGSACEYPKDAPIPLQEQDVWAGYPEESNAPYGIAKRLLLTQGLAYRQQYGMNVIHILPTNLYGPGDNFDLQTSHVISALIRKCVEAKESGSRTVSVWGDGTATRDFIFVRDAAHAIVLATELYNNPIPMNLGSGCETSIKSIAEMVKYATGFNGNFVWDASKPNGQQRRLLDTSRARSFGFVASTSFEQGLKETVAWFVRSR